MTWTVITYLECEQKTQKIDHYWVKRCHQKNVPYKQQPQQQQKMLKDKSKVKLIASLNYCVCVSLSLYLKFSKR